MYCVVLITQIKFWENNELSFVLSFHLSCRISGFVWLVFVWLVFKSKGAIHVELRKEDNLLMVQPYGAVYLK